VQPPIITAEHAEREPSVPVEAVRPTQARYRVLAFAVAMAVILYLDRMAISVAVPAIAGDLSLELSQVGDSLAAFFWCYALCQVPAGWLGDRWGGRKALTLYVVVWSLTMAGLGFVRGLASLIVMRALLGIGQAGAYATTAGFLRRWIPFSRRGLANSAVSLGGRAGNVLAPWLTAALMALVGLGGWTAGRWRPVFVVYALIGMVWAWFFWRWFRDEPRLHPQCNATEQNLCAVLPIGAAAGSETAPAAPVGALLLSPGLQLLGVLNFIINVGWIFIGTWLPTYLIKAHEFSELQAGFAASMTAAAGMAGCFVGGWGADLMVRRLGLAWGRRLPGLISYGGAALAYAACSLLDSPTAIVLVLIVASFFGDFALGALWAVYQDIGGTLAGTALGWANMCGNMGAAFAISLIGRMADANDWSQIFLLATIAYGTGAILWLGFDPLRPRQLARWRGSSPSAVVS
jgi:ACS family glucarate transporter-like MFS transporter